MDVALFHQKLLGKDPAKTPPEYRLATQHRRLYTAFTHHRARGFSGETTPARCLATLVLALYQTQLPGESESHRVAVLAHQSAQGVLQKTIEETARYCIRQRRGQPTEVIQRAFNSLWFAHRLLWVPETDRWTILGFDSDSLLPTWIQGYLL